ncbi:carboxymuconolactone decarboxylase family protein [Marinibaculum pumilum]|uniref:Carboxymuconolactone decarboxylase family protein n=1 Tax=Marinibaculum pumilum TaxID=1766165 RepID=A0ABV7L3G7_9PROT
MSEDNADLTKSRQGLYAPVPPEETAFHLWKQFDGDLALTFSKFFVGGLYQREVLTQRERQLCTVAALTVMRARDELRLHVHGARNRGASVREIAEVMFQMVTYGGAPSCVQALQVLRECLKERGEWDEESDQPKDMEAR